MKLINKRNSYAQPGSPSPGPWGQYLYFAGGVKEFDAGHSQSGIIARLTAQAAGDENATFMPGILEKVDGQWRIVSAD